MSIYETMTPVRKADLDRQLQEDKEGKDEKNLFDQSYGYAPEEEDQNWLKEIATWVKNRQIEKQRQLQQVA